MGGESIDDGCPTLPPAKKKKEVKRPDRAAALEERKDCVEKVVKCALSNRLVRDDNGACPLADYINERVHAISRATHRAGLVFLDIVHRYLDRRRRGLRPPFPTIFAELGSSDTSLTFFRQILTLDTSNRFVGESARGTFASYPSVERFKGDWQLYTYAAKNLATNVRNIVTVAFEARQTRYIKHWCSKAKSRDKLCWPILKAINGWGVQEPLTAEAQALVTVERSLLGLDVNEEVTTTWLKRNPDKVFEAYGRWLTILECDGAKRFALTPRFTVKSHHIKFDTDAMRALVRAAGLFDDNSATFRARSSWSEFIDVRGLATRKWTFTGLFETDGVACSVHFRRHLNNDERRVRDKKRAEAALTKLQRADRKAERARSPERLSREMAERKAATKLRSAARAKEKRAEAKAAKKRDGPSPPSSPSDGAVKAPRLGDGTVAHDPGVSPNVLFTVHQVGDQTVRRRFTVGRYYTEGGVKRLQALTTMWSASVQSEQDLLNCAPLATAAWASVRDHVDRFVEVGDALWSEKTKRRWARGRFDTYVRKPKALDGYFKEVASDGPVKRHFFGNASNTSVIKGCKPAPGTLAKRRARMAFPVPMEDVDEYLTTQACMRCGQRTQPVVRKSSNGVERKVRGLVFCGSRTCGCFTNRDFQGAHNIGVCGEGPRPKHLARQTAGGAQRSDPAMTPRYRDWFRGSNPSFGGREKPSGYFPRIQDVAVIHVPGSLIARSLAAFRYSGLGCPIPKWR